MFCFPTFVLVYGRRLLTCVFQECFGWLGWKPKGRIQHLFHVCFQSSEKREKIICSGELGTTPFKKLANIGLIIN